MTDIFTQERKCRGVTIRPRGRPFNAHRTLIKSCGCWYKVYMSWFPWSLEDFLSFTGSTLNATNVQGRGVRVKVRVIKERVGGEEDRVTVSVWVCHVDVIKWRIFLFSIPFLFHFSSPLKCPSGPYSAACELRVGKALTWTFLNLTRTASG